jgi:hypothetical protein
MKLRVAQLVKISRLPPPFCGTQRFIATLKNLTTDPYPEPDEPTLRPHTISFNILKRVVKVKVTMRLTVSQ